MWHAEPKCGGRETERGGEGGVGEEIKDEKRGFLCRLNRPFPDIGGDGECWQRFDGCLPIITSDLFRHAPLSSLKIQRVASPKSVSFQVISSAHFLSHYRVELVVCYLVGLTLI